MNLKIEILITYLRINLFVNYDTHHIGCFIFHGLFFFTFILCFSAYFHSFQKSIILFIYLFYSIQQVNKGEVY